MPEGAATSMQEAFLSKEGLTVAMFIAFNVMSVVGVVALNKVLYVNYGFKFPTCLMCFHFLCTFTFVKLVKYLGWYESKPIDRKNYIKLGAAQACSVGFVNLSLMYNSMGMYQLLKFTTILVMCVIEYVWRGRQYTVRVYVALVCLVAGISLATVRNTQVTNIGLVMGALGALTTAGYQVLNKAIQTENEVKALQLLEYEQPYTAAFAALFALFSDDIQGLASYVWTPEGMVVAVASGFCAFGVNVTTYLIIGKTSPVTFSVLGHTKTILILIFGAVVMGDIVTGQTGLGVVMAFLAIVAYSHYMTTGQGVVTAPPPPTPEEASPKNETA